MTPNLLNYLCELITKAPLQLVDAVTTADGTIQSGAAESDGVVKRGCDSVRD